MISVETSDAVGDEDSRFTTAVLRRAFQAKTFGNDVGLAQRSPDAVRLPEPVSVLRRISTERSVVRVVRLAPTEDEQIRKAVAIEVAGRQRRRQAANRLRGVPRCARKAGLPGSQPLPGYRQAAAQDV